MSSSYLADQRWALPNPYFGNRSIRSSNRFSFYPLWLNRSDPEKHRLRRQFVPKRLVADVRTAGFETCSPLVRGDYKMTQGFEEIR
jgi:hypothetical protein